MTSRDTSEAAAPSLSPSETAASPPSLRHSNPPSPLPWFDGRFPLFLAPMAGVSDKVFRQICKEQGADVLTTEFVSSEGIFRRNDRTREYLDFDPIERPVGVQLFGADPGHMAEAARHVVDWVQPDFIDLNFGCPVNKVVAKNGGAAPLRDRPPLGRGAPGGGGGGAPLSLPAQMRIGWENPKGQTPPPPPGFCGARAAGPPPP